MYGDLDVETAGLIRRFPMGLISYCDIDNLKGTRLGEDPAVRVSIGLLAKRRLKLTAWNQPLI